MSTKGWDEQELRRAEQPGEEVIIERLHALVRAGYTPRLGEPARVAFVTLEHRTGPTLDLWADGQVVDAYPTTISDDAKRVVIQHDDHEGFDRLMRAIR